jgi:hypothetical protein
VTPAAATSLTVDEAALVQAWSAAQAGPPWRRVPELLAELGLVGRDEAGRLPLGTVAAAVLRLVRGWSPAGRLAATAACRACGQRLEIGVPVDALLALENPACTGRHRVELADCRLTVRAPRPADLAAAAAGAGGDPVAAERLLLARCLVEADPPLPPDEDAALAAVVAAACEALDPLGVVSFSVTCPECGTADAPLADVIGWGWALVDARVRQLLGEVHRLASAYGWTEAEVLALGPWRRRVYLELVP